MKTARQIARKYENKKRKSAILHLQLIASNPEIGWFDPVIHQAVSMEGKYVAARVYHHVCRKLCYLISDEEYWDNRAIIAAEAECLLREGWEP